MVTIFYRSDFHMYNNKEVEVFYIVAQYCNGERYALHNSEYINNNNTPEEIEKMYAPLIKRIEDHIKAGGTINKEHWNELEPEYGSPAWQQWSRFN